MSPITSGSFLYASSLASYFFSPSFVPQWSPINLVYCSHHSHIWHPSLLFSSPPLFTPSFIPYSWHIFLLTLSSPLSFIMSHSSLILHHFGIPLLFLLSFFHPSILLAHFPSFLPSWNVFISIIGRKYGNVTISRQAPEISIFICQHCWPSAYHVHMHILLNFDYLGSLTWATLISYCLWPYLHHLQAV